MVAAKRIHIDLVNVPALAACRGFFYAMLPTTRYKKSNKFVDRALQTTQSVAGAFLHRAQGEFVTAYHAIIASD